MSATPDNKPASEAAAETTVPAAPEPGPVSQWLSQQGFDHDLLPADHIGTETIGVEAIFLPVIAAALKSHGFDYLQCQGGYDEGPGERLVCFYHLVAMAEVTEGGAQA
ncbi:MAG: NAD(P)H-quinone oxidoreductase subunit J, partial [Synechococcaceae bacterium WB9_4xC_028]|nr:NAD(P)H-quinone oxidoreductase subunit J [Synechococcaceae bacterium WB9_4xC_028]